MYSNEAKGTFPPMQVMKQNSNGTIGVQMAVGPAAAAVYPEYLTDPNISVCPSSPMSGKHLEWIKKEGLVQSPWLVAPDYIYLGWCLDRLKPCAAASSFVNMGVIASAGTTINGNTLIPIQIGAAVDGLSLMNLMGNNGAAAAADVDKDVDLSSTSWSAYGNGGSDKIYRFREGIERFLITDINNAGAGNMAQSSLWLMSDMFTTGSKDTNFNHVPGGCNVLFMDGHVEFIKYNAVSGLATMSAQQAEQALQGSTEPILATVAGAIGAIGDV
jgi:prepilin-type processing-associated H-X9-DG protein